MDRVLGVTDSILLPECEFIASLPTQSFISKYKGDIRIPGMCSNGVAECS